MGRLRRPGQGRGSQQEVTGPRGRGTRRTSPRAHFIKEKATMKKVLLGAVVVIAALIAVGYWQGWFKVQKGDDGMPHLVVDKEKYKQDKEKLKKLAGTKSQALKEKLARLREKAKDLKGDARTKADKEIDELTKKHEALDAKLKDLDKVEDDKFEELSKDLNGTLDQLDKDKE
jgi:uncharacterized protein HemX